MRRRLATAVILAVALVPGATAAAPAPARLQVSGDEFNLTLSRTTIRTGPAIVELVNYGEDDHDLALRRIGGTRTYRVGVVKPGQTRSLEARLRPGRFTLWCTLADHKSRGMRATLTVR
jgi:plastocyanin